MDLQRVQDVHALNNEIWYQIYRSKWEEETRAVEESSDLPSGVYILLEDNEASVYGELRTVRLVSE